ncbi:hypothetical protein [Bradyrhizobium ivorense]|uniref:hypothetical protein n=1 Tax=Bradyrhizobium ivorense TaxID=2511166 RepID=UPI001120F3D2|nr:hypothetical protein [Bradyrhizobium ivorense]
MRGAAACESGSAARGCDCALWEHDPEKCEAVFRKDHAQTKHDPEKCEAEIMLKQRAKMR